MSCTPHGTAQHVSTCACTCAHRRRVTNETNERAEEEGCVSIYVMYMHRKHTRDAPCMRRACAVPSLIDAHAHSPMTTRCIDGKNDGWCRGAGLRDHVMQRTLAMVCPAHSCLLLAWAALVVSWVSVRRRALDDCSRRQTCAASSSVFLPDRRASRQP